MRLVVFIIFLVMSSLVLASDRKINFDIHDNTCREIMAMANAVMITRQNGMPLGIALERADRMLVDKKADNEEIVVLKGMIREAYKDPKYATERYQQDSINEFAERYYFACMNLYRK